MDRIMCIEDISEEQAQKILDFLAQKHGFHKFCVEYYSSSIELANHNFYCCALENDSSSCNFQCSYLHEKLVTENAAWHTFMFISPSVSSKNALKAILDSSAKGNALIITQFTSNNKSIISDFIPAYTTLESILIDIDLKGFKAH